MPWRQVPMKAVDHCVKPRGAVNRRYIRGWPNGETRTTNRCASVGEYIAYGRRPGELKHLSTQRKRDHSASSGERTRISSNRWSLLQRGCRTQHMGVTNWIVSRIVLENRTAEGESPVGENNLAPAGHLSTTGHANLVGIWEAHFPKLNTLDDR
jgi:hypothetical protein